MYIIISVIVWVCYQLGIPCQLLTSSGLMKHSYLSLTQYNKVIKNKAHRETKGIELVMRKGAIKWFKRKACFCFMRVHNESLVSTCFFFTLLTCFPKAVKLSSTYKYIYVYIYPSSKTLQFEVKKKIKCILYLLFSHQKMSLFD